MVNVLGLINIPVKFLKSAVYIEADEEENIARIANAVPVTLYSRVTITMYMLILLFSIVRHVISAVSQVSSIRSFGLLFEGVF